MGGGGAMGQLQPQKEGGTMERRSTCSAAVRAAACALVLLASVADALAQTATERARNLLREEKAQQAFELLEPQADQLADAESAYLLGIAALDVGRAAWPSWPSSARSPTIPPTRSLARNWCGRWW